MAKKSSHKDFLKKGRKFADEMFGKTDRFEKNKELVAEFVSVEDVTFKAKKGKNKGKKINSSIIHLKDEKGNLFSYWSFGLLNSMLKKGNAKTGDMLYIKYLGKNDDGFHQCKFYKE